MAPPDQTLGTFLTNINTAYVEYVDRHNDTRKVVGDYVRFEEITLLYLKQYIYMINKYFSVDITVDENFCSSTDIEYLVGCANEIMGTHYAIDFDIDNFTAIDSIWENLDRWYYYTQEA